MREALESGTKEEIDVEDRGADGGDEQGVRADLRGGAGAQAASEDGAGGESSDEEVVDAEVVDEGDES